MDKGEAIVYFNRSNIRVARELIQVLKDNKQDVPQWLGNMANEAGGTAKGGGPAYGGGVGGPSWW